RGRLAAVGGGRGLVFRVPDRGRRRVLVRPARAQPRRQSARHAPQVRNCRRSGGGAENDPGSEPSGESKLTMREFEDYGWRDLLTDDMVQIFSAYHRPRALSTRPPLVIVHPPAGFYARIERHWLPAV